MRIRILLVVAAFLGWNYKRLSRCQMRNVRRRDFVLRRLAYLTRYEDEPAPEPTMRERADAAIDEIIRPPAK